MDRLPLNGNFFAARFRELASQFDDPVATSPAARAIEICHLQTAAGELIVAAVKRGLLNTLPGAKSLVAKYEYEVGETAAENASGVRPTICPANLFLDVAGWSLIEVFNDSGNLRPIGEPRPGGLLPDAAGEFFPATGYTLAAISAKGTERADFRRLADAEHKSRLARACRMLAELVAKDNSPPSAPPEPPQWNKETGNLTIDGNVAKRIRNIGQAKNVVCILDSFQDCGWPARIDDPLPGCVKGQKRRDRLGYTVGSLNDGLVAMLFSRDGTTEGIRWERAPSSDAPPTLP